jgi:hypothetical protein
MRYYTYAVGAALVRELKIAGAVKRILHDGRDIIHLELVSGDSLMIHLIDSGIPLYEIKNTFERNTADGHYTLFILWIDLLLPDHGSRAVLEGWHDGLLAAYNNRIYGYSVYMERLFLYPLYFDKQYYKRERVVRFGDPIDVGAIDCRTVRTTMPGLNGTWRVAGFEGSPASYYHRKVESLPNWLLAYYATLKIKPGADLATIKKAYRDLARIYHPDVNDNQSTAEMQAINRAYDEILKAMEDQR